MAAAALNLMVEGLRRTVEAGLNEVGKPQREEADKLRKEQIALQKKQEDDLTQAGRDKETKSAQAANIADLKASTAGQAGRQSTLLGVLNPAASSAQTKVKTLLGE